MNFFVWLAFFIPTIFMVVFKASMIAGNETHPFAAFVAYWQQKPLTIILRFALAQLFLFFVWDNPKLVGDLLGTVGVGTFEIPARWWLASALGFASDKLADIIMVAAQWAYRKATGYFA